MPPVNSPSQDTEAVHTSTSPFFELEALARPVPDLASTLTTTQAEQDANDANVSFLRTPISDEEFNPTSSIDQVRNSRRQLRAERESRQLENSDSESQRRMHQIQAATAINQRRYSPSELRELHDRASPAAQFSSLGYHGWAPPADAGRGEPEHWSGLPTMSTSSAEFYDEQRRALLSAARQMQSSSRELQASLNRGTGPATATGTGTGTSSAAPTSEVAQSSLRTAALLQSVRRNPHFSRSRGLIHDQMAERDRSSQGNDSPDFSSLLESRRRSWQGSRSVRHREHPPSTAVTSSLHDLARRDWILSGYQRQQEEELRRQQDGSKWNFEDAIKYLERLRFCESYQESVSSAAAGGFVREDFYTTNQDDFILDTAMIDPPAQSSWLRIGGVFSGFQDAKSESYGIRRRSVSRENRPNEVPQLGQAQALPTNRHSFSYTWSNSSSQAPTRQARSRVPFGTYENVDQSSRHSRTLPLNSAAERSLVQAAPVDRLDERWPVRVSIGSVDYDNMTLTGTMEAFNVPDKNSSTQVSGITTFLEGEIIDFNLHTLETKNYQTEENDEMVRGLVSKKWMREELREKYILMRWKEKSVIKPLEAHSVLTISGFYYVSLRRSDGHIEGLYYDPSSTPFQHLTMAPDGKRYFPAYALT
ncbi:MAG: hypothetical protein LQ345_003910 [Seirophora villosa]|nr:MAG: hypothetical protein LQ345_003910 [Seirophora villosa]